MLRTTAHFFIAQKNAFMAKAQSERSICSVIYYMRLVELCTVYLIKIRVDFRLTICRIYFSLEQENCKVKVN